MRVNVRRADGSPARNVYVQVYRQKADLSGNPVADERVESESTDNVGTVFFELAPDSYVVAVSLTGYGYGDPFNHTVESGSVRVLDISLGQILVGVLDAEGKAMQNRYVQVYLQKPDLGGNPVTDERVASDSTDNTGAIQFDLTAGYYRVTIGGIDGEPYGDEFNHRVVSGETNKIIVRLGRLTIGLQDASGKPIASRYVQVFRQNRDVAGNISQGERINSDSTENTGLLSFDLTPGKYIVEISDIGRMIDVPIESGRVTFSNGTTFEVR